MSRLPRPAPHVLRAAETEGEPGAHANVQPAAAAAGVGVGSVESLYPFIYSGAVDLDQVVAQARQSTVRKIREIIDLRAEVCAGSSELLGSCAKEMAARFAAGGRLLTFGNGGSATDAQEIAALFMYPQDADRSLPAIGLASDVSVLTSLANDIGVEVMFSRQIAAFGRTGDIALGLSTSGNSENLLRAFDQARRGGLMTVGIAGYDGGKMAEIASLDYLFVAPSASIHRIQEAQTTVYHILWELVVAEMAARPVIT
jgi:D-sedoheptulose 7-phosphate isomerase